MENKIDKKIVGYKVIAKEEATEAPKVSGGTPSNQPIPKKTIQGVDISTDRLSFETTLKEELTAIAETVGVSYEALTGDYSAEATTTSRLSSTLENLSNIPKGKRNKYIDLESLISSLQKKELKRPLRLDNEWRLKPPKAEHALYVRLNAITHEGKKYPYEIFFNTKDVTQIEWLNALTLTLSIAFRTAIETDTSLVSIIENLKETFGTQGSYLSKVPEKPKFVNGLVAEIGYVIEEFNNECLAWNYENYVYPEGETAKGAYEALGELDKLAYKEAVPKTQTIKDARFNDGTKMDVVVKITNPCTKCGEQLILMDGCLTCTGCGDSKCG